MSLILIFFDVVMAHVNKTRITIARFNKDIDNVYSKLWFDNALMAIITNRAMNTLMCISLL